MIFQTGKKPDNILILNCQNLITTLALLCLWVEKMIIKGQRLVNRQQITLLAYYDYSQRIIKGHSWLWPVGKIFVSFYVIFLLIEILEGLIKWLQ